MRKGKILYVNEVHGHGLIEDENQQEIAFNLANLQAKVSVSDEVLFDITMGKCGLMAVDITLP
jgi:cold shock CspA family protein